MVKSMWCASRKSSISASDPSAVMGTAYAVGARPRVDMGHCRTTSPKGYRHAPLSEGWAANVVVQPGDNGVAAWCSVRSVANPPRPSGACGAPRAHDPQSKADNPRSAGRSNDAESSGRGSRAGSELMQPGDNGVAAWCFAGAVARPPRPLGACGAPRANDPRLACGPNDTGSSGAWPPGASSVPWDEPMLQHTGVGDPGAVAKAN